MCGIAGILDKNNESSDLIESMIKSLEHRGPDGSRVWWDPKNNLTLGHNLLSIMADPNLSMQPIQHLQQSQIPSKLQ